MEKILGVGQHCEIELKSFDGKEGVIEGYAAKFNNIDLGNDKIMPGAFKRTLKANKGKIPILADHKWDQQIGWNMEASEDKDGLFVRGQLNLKVRVASEKYELAKQALENGIKSGLSIGYAAVSYEDTMDKETERRYRKLKELKLYEYSLVTFPMNEEASLTAAKNFDDLFDEEISEAELVEKFVAKLKEKGFNESNIKSALERTAAKFKSPSDIRHLFEMNLKDLKIK